MSESSKPSTCLGMPLSGYAVSIFSRWENNRHGVAIVHFWLVSMRGGEKVLEALCQLFPEADIFTHVYDPGLESETIRKHKIVYNLYQFAAACARYYKHYSR